MGSKTWGNPLTVKQYVVVGENEEIPKGEYSYVFNQQVGSANIFDTEWEALVNGDLSSLKDKIEREIRGTKVQFLRIYWTRANYVKGVGYPPPRPYYVVEGFKIEAIVKNESANLTGLEIISIIIGLAILAAVIGLLVMVGWIAWRIISAAEQLGAPVTIGVGLILVLVFIFALLMLFGVKAEYKGKKRQVRMGK